jgi:hypothetical protein
MEATGGKFKNLSEGYLSLEWEERPLLYLYFLDLLLFTFSLFLQPSFKLFYFVVQQGLKDV